MPYLVKKIEGNLLNFYETSPLLFKNISGVVGIEDFIKINNFIGFTQNFSQVIKVEEQLSLTNYGLKHNLTTINLEISY